MPDIIGDPAFLCLGLASTEDGLIVISLRLRFLSCCGVTGNSLFPGSAVKYLENISHSFSSPELLMCTPLTSLVSNKGFIALPCLSLIPIFFKKPLTWFHVSFILIRCCPQLFLGSILHTAICDFGKVCFIFEIARVAVILIWSVICFSWRHLFQDTRSL